MDTTADIVPETPETPEVLPLWRLRVELHDRPGALAALTAGLAGMECNVLALAVLPVVDGVIDDVIISTPAGLRPAELVTLVRSVGGRCAGITRADRRDLADAPTAALRAALRVADGSAGYAEAVRCLTGADAVAVAGSDLLDEPHADPTVAPADGRRVTVATADGRLLELRRGWAPFTEVELARSAALADLVETLGAPAADAVAVVTADGAGVVLRPGQPRDADAVAAMHDRCSRATLFARYHAGTQTVPRRLLHRLLAPPRGRTVVGVLGHQVIALGQLINTTNPATAEISLLVEDDWQGNGIGAALLNHLVRTARAAGHQELVGWCLPGDRSLVRTAARAGVPTSTRYEDQLLRVSVDLHEHPADREPLPAN